jgi:uncharacterized cupredoxin-like copper-binding protein
MFFREIPGALLKLGVLVAGCKSDRSANKAASPAPSSDSLTGSPAAAPAPATVTVTASDFTLDLPAKIPAGTVTLRLVNHGRELHQAQIIRLEEGKTVADFAAAMNHPGPHPSWVKFVGGPNGIAPGQETESSAMLTPGQYAVFCIIPSPDGVAHLMKGMIRPVEVTTAAAAAEASLPAADDTVRLADYTFQPSRALTPGRHTILVENAGPQPHELVLLKLPPGKSVGDFGQWAEGGMKGPPPAMPLGGVAVLDKGGSGVFTAELSPGDYGFICFVPDAKDGKPHLAHGLMKQFKVG